MTEVNRGVGQAFVISAPSGAGKTSLVKALVERDATIEVSVSHTTRTIRPGEQDGINYHFINEQAFRSQIADDAFLEHAQVFGNYYGTSRRWVEQRLSQGQDVILEIDWQGAQQVRAQLPGVISIFILPPSLDALRQRLIGRGQDDESTIAARMEQSESESSHYDEFDYLVINDDFDQALKDLHAIFVANRQLLSRQSQKYRKLIDNLLPSGE